MCTTVSGGLCIVELLFVVETDPSARSHTLADLRTNPGNSRLHNIGHERPLTQIKFNAEGDLLFTCSKDYAINVWFSHNGERIGTYDGNNGSVWTVDVDCKLSSNM